jgi:hypothetical protein
MLVFRIYNKKVDDNSRRNSRRFHLIGRKHDLRGVTSGLSSIVYADHVEGSGTALFKKACELDLRAHRRERRGAPYDPQRSTWFKIRNRNYSQLAGREELFERERHAVPVPGWHTCALAAAAAS